MVEPRLLMISRDDILQAGAGKQGEKLFRTLARLTRMGFQLLATAPQPDDWSKDHGGPDDALLGPESIRKRLADAGGVLDGVYYVPKSLFTQKRNRESALRDIMLRYGIEPAYCHMFSSSRKFVEVAAAMGVNAAPLADGKQLMQALKTLLTQAESQSAAKI
jgi:hypothetical protein